MALSMASHSTPSNAPWLSRTSKDQSHRGLGSMAGPWQLHCCRGRRSHLKNKQLDLELCMALALIYTYIYYKIIYIYVNVYICVYIWLYINIIKIPKKTSDTIKETIGKGWKRQLSAVWARAHVLPEQRPNSSTKRCSPVTLRRKWMRGKASQSLGRSQCGCLDEQIWNMKIYETSKKRSKSSNMFKLIQIHHYFRRGFLWCLCFYMFL